MSIAKADITHRNRALAATLTLALCLIGLAAFGTTYAEARKGTIPQGNLVQNPSFKQSARKGWAGFEASVKRVRDRQAPDGSTVAWVKAAGGAQTYTIDDSGASAKNVSTGTTVEGSAWVRGIRRSVGQPVELVVREWDGEAYAGSESVTTTLTRRWQQLTVGYTAQGDGNDLDLYVARPEGSVNGRERFAVDAVTLAPVGGDEVLPASVDPTGGDETPTAVDSPPVDDDIPPAPVNPTGGLTTYQMAFVSSQEDPLFNETDARYRFIVIRDNLHDRVAELRQVHPESKIILYKNVGFTLYEPGCPWDPYQGGGVSYCTADSHESWFLHDSSGQRITSDSYSSQRAMNVASSGYRQEWLSSVRARLRDANGDGIANDPYDGVWMDDVNMFPGHGMDGRIAEHSDAAYQQAAVGFVHAVSPELRAQGFYTIANVGMNPWEADDATATLQVAKDLSAVHREGLVRWGEGTTFTTDGAAPHWMDEVHLAEQVQAAGADFHAITYGSSDDVEAQRYARATFLLAWDGNDGSAFGYRPTNTGDAWLSDWTTDVGVPTSARYRVGQGWRRDFSVGTVVINPTDSGPQSFSLGGSFRRPDGSCVSSVNLVSAQAMVMPSC